MNGLYNLIYNWYKSQHYEYHEGRYKDKVESPFGNETEIETKGELKLTEYVKNIVEISTHQWESKDIQVKVGGNEVTMMQGRIEIKIEAKIITDWQNKFEKGTIWESAQNFMENTIIKRDIDNKYIDPLDKQLHALSRDIKRFLKIDSVG